MTKAKPKKSGKSFLSKKTRETDKIETLLSEDFERVDAYRLGPYTIRVRVIDPQFKKMSRVARDDLVSPYLEKLPEATQADILILLLLAPGELSTSMMNVEFEHPVELDI